MQHSDTMINMSATHRTRVYGAEHMMTRHWTEDIKINDGYTASDENIGLKVDMNKTQTTRMENAMYMIYEIYCINR